MNNCPPQYQQRLKTHTSDTNCKWCRLFFCFSLGIRSCENESNSRGKNSMPYISFFPGVIYSANRITSISKLTASLYRTSCSIFA